MQQHPPLDLTEIENTPLSPLMKGIPAGASLPLKAIGQQDWNLLAEDLPLPLAVLRQSALERNRRWMARFIEETGVLFAPHGKTTMSPQLFDMQLRDDAWAITAATVGHVHVYRHFGVQRIILANQLVGKPNIAFILDELAKYPDFDFYCIVDSAASATTLAQAVREHGLGRPLQVLLEIGATGGRTGVRDAATALELARTIADLAPYLSLRGIECFEATASLDPNRDPTEQVVAMLTSTASIGRQVQVEGLFAPGEVMMTAGGSSHFDLVVKYFGEAGLEFAVIVLRSGCYISHDSKHYIKYFNKILDRVPASKKLGPGLTAALEIWGYVQSLPEPGLAICTFGKRDLSYDVDLPVARYTYRPGVDDRPRALSGGYAIHTLNDQHAYLSVPEDHGLRIGDMVCVGISHPCTTFDKWQIIPIVDDEYNVVSAIRTFF
jgi:D-serine dehydratase